MDKVTTGEFQIQDLINLKQLWMNIHSYRSIFLHAVAAIQLTNIEIEFQGAKTSKSTLQSISCGVLDYEIPVLRNVT